MSLYETEDVPTPKRPHRQKQYIPHYPLDMLFSEPQFGDKMSLAQRRIVQAFDEAYEIRRGKVIHTRTYIGNIGSRQKDLVKHIIDNYVRKDDNGFVTASELPPSIERRHLRGVAHQAEKGLVTLSLNWLCDRKDVWYNQYATGIWEIRQGIVDQYRLDKREAQLNYGTLQTLRREKLHGGGRLRVVH